MATLPNSSARSSGGQSLNLAMAGLAALALAFFTYAMPDDLFSSLVSRSGLPGLVAAAEPPLGMKARAAVIAAVAILIFAAVLLLFRAIDRISARPTKVTTDTEDAEAPRVRRADAHPDAPARRPLLAGRDLGDYVEPEEKDDDFDLPPVEEKFADLDVRPLPGFLAAEEADAPEAAIENPPVFHAQPSCDTDIDTLVSQLPDIGEIGGHESISELMQRLESGLSQRELSAGAEPVSAEPAPARRAPMPQWFNSAERAEADESAPVSDSTELAQAEADEPEATDFAALRSSGRRISEFGEIESDEPEAAEFEAPRSKELDLSGFAEIEPEAEADDEGEGEEEEAEDESVGLGYASLRTRTPLDLSQPFPQAPEPAAEEVAPPVEPQVGHRLRGTINDLRRIASRG